MRNLDYILTISSHTVASTSLDILANLERALDQRSSEPWSHRQLPTVTATFPAIINSEDDDSEMEFHRTRDKPMELKLEKDPRLDLFLQPKDDPNQENSRVVRALRKKLQQIEMLEVKQSKGHHLDDQQIAKIQCKSALERSLAELGVPVGTSQNKVSSSVPPQGKGSKKGKLSRKQRKMSKPSVVHNEVESVNIGRKVPSEPTKDMLDIEILEVSDLKVGFHLHCS